MKIKGLRAMKKNMCDKGVNGLGGIKRAMKVNGIKRIKGLVTVMAAAAATCAAIEAAAADAPLWLRNSSISPDGRQIAFTYQGDIYKVATEGGRAQRLTSSPAYDTAPVWSPDGKLIAFASDRHGNGDIYVMSSEGGAATRLTTHSAAETPQAFSADGKQVYYTASIQAPASSCIYPSSRMTQLYAVDVAGNAAPRQVAPIAMERVKPLPGGKGFIYQDVKGMENTWRKHHTSSVTRDIRLYDTKKKRTTNLTNHAGEDRDPMVSADGRSYYFLSERDGGTMNVYRASLDGKGAPEQVTRFEKHPVRYLSGANDGTLAMSYDGELWTLKPGGEPRKVDVEIVIDTTPQTERMSVSPRGGMPSADGKQVAFTHRGDVYATSVEHESMKQVTATAGAESDVNWAPDGRKVAYTSKRGGRYNIYISEIARKDDPNMSNATIINERAAVADDGVERAVPKFSPDGKKLAFIEGRKRLMVKDLASGAVTQLTDGSNYPYSDGRYDYEWSPDSKWITLAVDDNHHSPYTDIALVNVGSGEMTHLTRSGYTDEAPRFAMGGNAIIYLTERYGMRNHASWGSQNDIVAIFLNRDAYDRFRLSKEDYELRKELDKKQKKSDKKDDKKDKADKADDAADSGSNDIVVELDGIADRTARLTPFSGDITSGWLSDDGRTLYFLASVGKGYDLWKMDFDERKPSVTAKLGVDYGEIVPTKDGKTLFVMGDKIKKYETAGAKVSNVSGSMTAELDRRAERREMFDDVVESEREMFYDTAMHGVDWDALAADYRRFLPHINNNYDYAEMLSELLGELNVSHTGATYRGTNMSEYPESTPSLGLLYDMTYSGPGLKVAEVVSGGPFDRSSSRLRPGMVITAINGVTLDASTDMSAPLRNLSGKKTLVEISDGGKKFEEVVIPITRGAMSDLMYDRWVKGRAAAVDKLSGGRLGYVHIDAMDDASFRKVYSDLLGKYNDREGVVIDIRWNGGGRLHEDVEVLFSGDKYFTQVIRGTETCDMPSRRYNKPSIMLMAEPCYSNAHGTPWVYSHQGLGKLVGMPVAGTMTSVNWVRLQDQSMTFGIPVVGYRLADGSYLENTQLEPDVKVENLAEDVARGEDAQLRRAVEELLRQIDSAK